MSFILVESMSFNSNCSNLECRPRCLTIIWWTMKIKSWRVISVIIFIRGFNQIQKLFPLLSDCFTENDPAGRFFIVVYNSTTTVSAAYATLIALAIAAIIGALLGGLYYLLLSAKSEMSSGGYESSRFFKSKFYTEFEILVLKIWRVVWFRIFGRRESGRLVESSNFGENFKFWREIFNISSSERMQSCRYLPENGFDLNSTEERGECLQKHNSNVKWCKVWSKNFNYGMATKNYCFILNPISGNLCRTEQLRTIPVLDI